MATWNHRVMRHKHTFPESGETEVTLAIHEVYYKDQTVDDCEVSADDVGYTETPVAVMGESIEELRDTLQRMLKALDKPVLEQKQPMETQEKIWKLRGGPKWEGNLDQMRGGDE